MSCRNFLLDGSTYRDKVKFDIRLIAWSFVLFWSLLINWSFNWSLTQHIQEGVLHFLLQLVPFVIFHFATVYIFPSRKIHRDLKAHYHKNINSVLYLLCLFICTQLFMTYQYNTQNTHLFSTITQFSFIIIAILSIIIKNEPLKNILLVGILISLIKETISLT